MQSLQLKGTQDGVRYLPAGLAVRNNAIPAASIFRPVKRAKRPGEDAWKVVRLGAELVGCCARLQFCEELMTAV